ncbi:UDP-N-acetylglucosamine 1-carboxyvinyltransferase [bacterium]|nr:UDP-N-acetylglucosamine 1-carboxyvinyltransferase [bacterium]
MSRMVIDGGFPLSGSVRINGAKNSALPIMAASILCQGPIVLKNIPKLNDVETMAKVLEALGIKIQINDCGDWKLSSFSGVNEEAPYELVKTMRASFFVMGPLLARRKCARVPLPGGCAIGVRPVNIHLKGFEALGARVGLDAGYAVAKADKLIGTKVHFDFPSVGATENLMMAATLAEGTTIIENAAREPEIEDLADFINSMGGKIKGAGTPTISIDGVNELGSVEYKIIPDRIEAGTFMVLGALSKGAISVENCIPVHSGAVIEKLREMGACLDFQDSRVIVSGKKRLLPVELKTLPFPGFPTDMQAQFMVAMCLAGGTSIITESVFENRFMHVGELIRMGANLSIRDRTVVIKGVEKLKGAPLVATDLRAGAAMVIAGLVADGRTEVSKVHHIHRGYQNFVERINALGAKIQYFDGDGDE